MPAPPRAPPLLARLELLAELRAVAAPVDIRRRLHRPREVFEELAEVAGVLFTHDPLDPDFHRRYQTDMEGGVIAEESATAPANQDDVAAPRPASSFMIWPSASK